MVIVQYNYCASRIDELLAIAGGPIWVPQGTPWAPRSQEIVKTAKIQEISKICYLMHFHDFGPNHTGIPVMNLMDFHDLGPKSYPDSRYEFYDFYNFKFFF